MIGVIRIADEKVAELCAVRVLLSPLLGELVKMPVRDL
jgi:hypothetical protein